jgi:hypothetical protein
MKTRFLLVLLLGLSLQGHAQWLTQTNTLKAGWNAVYMHVDASYTTLADLVASDASNPILEVWLWAPTPSTMQFITSPLNPLETGGQWVSWVRGSDTSSLLRRLIGNAAYLVKVGSNVETYEWRVKGKPLPPKYQWTTTGLNFLGFPVVTANPPWFDTFLAQCPVLQQNAQIFHYVGGDLGPGNPVPLIAWRTTPVTRGQAYWVRAGQEFNRYFGPFETAFSNPRGIDFADELSVASFRVRNLTAGPLTVTLHLLASETPPSSEPVPAAVPPLLVRGSLDITNLTYGYSTLALGGTKSWTLEAQGAPGSEAEIVLGLNRAALTDPADTLLAGILRLTDSLGFSQVDAPVAARVGSSAGLWMGSAVVAQVGEYLKSYVRGSDGSPVIQTNGAYGLSGISTNLGSVPRMFPLRLIVHNPEVGNAVLLQRVYLGLDANTNAVIARQESVLNRKLLAQAKRISATHLPWTADNASWAFNGRWPETTNLAATITLDYNQASNPFVHTYHPDHDNLNATFSDVLPQGAESYSVSRDIQLNINPPDDDFSSLTAGGKTVSGAYLETITISGLARATGSDTRQFHVGGAFSLNRITEVPVLTTSP